mmetsp:Transcript_65577/g.129885  ORF Transcript_65577/g.129885 Transcript_65577/m.129885 type:complete len:208 (-) Transcript_65577:113-736(-)
MKYTFGIVLRGEVRTLSIDVPRVPTSLSDLAELITTYGDAIHDALAPVDISIQLGNPNRQSQVCLPEICVYIPVRCPLNDPEPRCCKTLCGDNNFAVSASARFQVGERVTVSATLSVDFAGGGNINGIDLSNLLPPISREFSHTITSGDTATGSSLCDVIPAVGEWIRDFTIGGEICWTVLGIEGCITTPVWHLSSIIKCDSDTFVF